MLLTPAKDARLKWVKLSPTTHQLLALDGGSAGTVVLLPKHMRYTASTHRTYLGGFDTEQEAKRAVEDKVELECN